MSKPDLVMTLGAKAAMSKDIDIKATVEVDLHVSRLFIWVLKLRYIWAIIKSKVAHE